MLRTTESSCRLLTIVFNFKSELPIVYLPFKIQAHFAAFCFKFFHSETPSSIPPLAQPKDVLSIFPQPKASLLFPPCPNGFLISKLTNPEPIT